MKPENLTASDVIESAKPDPPAKMVATGPRSEAGKRRSGTNAIRYGVFANSIIEGESFTRFRALVRALRDDLGIAGATEELLIEKMAVNFWRHGRLFRAEAGEFLRSTQLRDRFQQGSFDDPDSLGLESSQNNLTDSSSTELGQTSHAETTLPSVDQLANLMAYERHLGREIDRTFDQLERVLRLKQFALPTSNQSEYSSIRKPGNSQRKRGNIHGNG